MGDEFGIGDRVRWQYRGEDRIGVVVEVVNPGRQPQTANLKPVDRLSYIVETDCGKRYRPLDMDLVETWSECLGHVAEPAYEVLKRIDSMHFATLAFYGMAVSVAISVAAIFIAIRSIS